MLGIAGGVKGATRRHCPGEVVCRQRMTAVPRNATNPPRFRNAAIGRIACAPLRRNASFPLLSRPAYWSIVRHSEVLMSGKRIVFTGDRARPAATPSRISSPTAIPCSMSI